MGTFDQFRYDPDIGYTFIPDLRLRVAHEAGGYLLSTNSLGFREVEYDAGQRATVCVMGDSFTAGDGVSNGQRWTDELQRLMPSGVAVRNFGLPSTGTDQQYLAWRKFVADRRCDLLLVTVLVENIRRNTTAYRPVEGPDGEPHLKPKPYFSLGPDGLALANQPVPRDAVPARAVDGAADPGGRFPALRRLASATGLRDVAQSLTGYQPVPEYDDRESHGWRMMSAILRRWSDECACTMAIVPLPLYQHVEGTADAGCYQARFAELGAVTGRAIVDPLPELRRHPVDERRRFRFPVDIHLTPLGHSAVARAIAPAVQRLIGAHA